MARSDDEFRSGTSRDIENEIEAIEIVDENVTADEEFEGFEEFEEFENEESKEEHETGNETVVNDLIYDVADKVVEFLEGSSEEDNEVMARVLNYINTPKERRFKEKVNLKPTITKGSDSTISTSIKARKRLMKSLVTNIFMNAILLFILTYAIGIVKGVTIEDLYMYGYTVKNQKDVEVLSFIENYNSTHANSYLIPYTDSDTGEYKRLSLVVENVNFNNYKEWDVNTPESNLIEYFSIMDEDVVYNMELEAYKLGDEVALSMFEKFGTDLTFGVYIGETRPNRYGDSVYDYIDTSSPHAALVLMYDFEGEISRDANFPDNSPDYFSGNGINNLPDYKGVN